MGVGVSRWVWMCKGTYGGRCMCVWGGVCVCVLGSGALYIQGYAITVL